MALATPTRRMPASTALSRTLTDLLGQDVTASTTEIDLDSGQLFSTTLIDDDDVLAGAIVANLSFACATGGGMVMLPEKAVKKAVDSGELDGQFRENFYEVTNILSSLVNGPAVVHVRAAELVDGVPEETRALVLRARGRRSFDVSFTGYGDGKVAFYAS